MVLVPFSEIPYGDRLAKSENSQYIQVIPRSMPRLNLCKPASSIKERPLFKKYSFNINFCCLYSRMASDRERLLMARLWYTSIECPKYWQLKAVLEIFFCWKITRWYEKVVWFLFLWKMKELLYKLSKSLVASIHTLTRCNVKEESEWCFIFTFYTLKT